MKTSRFIQPARRNKGPAPSYASVVKQTNSSDEEFIAMVPTESSTQEDFNNENNDDGDARSIHSHASNQQQEQTPTVPTTPHPVDSSQDTSKQSGSSNETSVEEVIIGLDHSFKASRWNSANSITGSILSVGSSVGEEEKNDAQEISEDMISPNSVHSVTGVWEVRSKGSVDSAAYSLERANNNNNGTDINSDDYSAITEVYNEWDSNNVEDKKSSVPQPMLTSTSPTSDDGLEDDHLFPEVDRQKFRMLKSGPSAFSTVVKPPEPPSNNQAAEKSNNYYYYWKHVAFWLAVIVCWLKLASGLRFHESIVAQQQPPAEPIEIEPNLLALGLNHEL